MRDYEQYDLCHKDTTAGQHYLDAEIKKGMALSLSSWFRAKITGVEEFVSKENFDVFISEKHSNLIQKGSEEVEKTKLSRYIERVKRMDAEIQPTLEKTITPIVRSALLELIAKCGKENLKITSKGNTLEVFLSGKPVKNNTSISIMIRMLELSPPEWECRKILVNNLLVFASMKAGTEGLTPRFLKIEWAKKLLEVLKHIRTRGSVDHPVVLSIFADLCSQYGFKYVMGNSALTNQMKIYLQQADKRKNHTDSNCVSRKTLSQWDDERIHKTKTQRNKTDAVSNQTNCCSKDSDCLPLSSSVAEEDGNLEMWETAPIVRAMPVPSPLDMSPGAPTPQGDFSEDVSASMNGDCIGRNRETPVKKRCHQDAFSEGFSAAIVDDSFGRDRETPVKKRFSLDFNNEDIKLQLLESYVRYSPNPMLVGTKERNRKKELYLQCVTLRNKAMVDGQERKAWKEISNPVTLADKLYRQGFNHQGWANVNIRQGGKGQGDKSTGLYQFIVDTIGEVSNEEAKEKVGLLLRVAKAKME